jgi:hypothetical protein
MKRKLLCIGLPALLAGSVMAAPMGTALSYQGELAVGGNPTNGSYDLRFTLYDDASGGAAVAGPITNSAVDVTNGLFKTTVDFGDSVFDGDALWLELAARSNGVAEAFEVLSPRHALRPLPYALYAPTAQTALAVVSNAVTGSALQDGAVTAAKIASGEVVKSLNGLADDVILAGGSLITVTTNGQTLTISAAGSGGVGWALTGNGETEPTINFLGTTDYKALVLRVNNSRALTLDTNGSLVGGFCGNEATGAGATVAGGGNLGATNRVAAAHGTVSGGLGNVIEASAFDATISGGRDNLVSSGAQHASIGGGYSNRVAGWSAAIGGGSWNMIEQSCSAIGGGSSNMITGVYQHSTIGGGVDNRITSDKSVIGGGSGNSVDGQYVTVGGGADNTVIGDNATISGGLHNTSHSPDATIGGGQNNTVSSNSPAATIAGGQGNAIDINCTNAAIAGGGYNHIMTNSQYGFIGGGYLNQLWEDADYSTVGGGYNNKILSVQGNNHSACVTIGGGGENLVDYDSMYTTIAGGSVNRVLSTSRYSSIGGGANNSVSSNAYFSTIAGGEENKIGTWAKGVSVGGGSYNTATASYAAIAGGATNTATGAYAAIAGGCSNTVSGNYAAIPGGYMNIASGPFSLAAGQRAQAKNQGSFVWADSTFANFASTDDNQFLIRASNGVGIGTDSPAQQLHVAGRIRMNTWTADGSTLVYKNASGDIGVQASDARLKQNVTPIPDALKAVRALSGVTFNWRSDPAGAKKTVGLIAQEVQAVMPELTFECRGEDGQTYLGVHYEKVTAVLVNAIQEQQTRIDRQTAEIVALKSQAAELAKDLAELRAHAAGPHRKTAEVIE